MKYIWYIISICTLFTYYSQAQHSPYLFQRQASEDATTFVQRYMNALYDDIDLLHTVIEGYWGDESKGKKIVAFTSLPLLQEYDKATMLVFQPIGDGKHYIVSLYNDLNYPGLYYSGIASVFFVDANDDGHKELFVLEAGEVRVATTIYEEGDDGNITSYETTACCEEVYATNIIEQVYYGQGNFLPVFRYYETPAHWDFDDLSTAGKVKAALRNFKQKD
jgi:hypothetical protein